MDICDNLKLHPSKLSSSLLLTGHIPKPLLEQLKEGGRMVVPVGTYSQVLKKIVKRSGRIETSDIIPVVFVPMTGEGVKQKK